MSMNRTIFWNDVAPANNVAVKYSNELRVTFGDVVHHKLVGAVERRSFEKCKVLSFVGNEINAPMEAFDVLGRDRHSLHIHYGSSPGPINSSTSEACIAQVARCGDPGPGPTVSVNQRKHLNPA